MLAERYLHCFNIGYPVPGTHPTLPLPRVPGTRHPGTEPWGPLPLLPALAALVKANKTVFNPDRGTAFTLACAAAVKNHGFYTAFVGV